MIFSSSALNPLIDTLQPYPFEKLRILLKDSQPPSFKSEIGFGIGEPKHAVPQLIKDAFKGELDSLSIYPSTIGSPLLRQSIADWLKRRFSLKNLDWQTQVLPASGTREALFSIAQVVVDRQRINKPIVVCPNPFYQIYEGASILSGAQVYYANSNSLNGFSCEYNLIPSKIWKETQLIYVCSPGNPTGSVLSIEEWRLLFNLSDKYGFVIVSDECYSEIYFDKTLPPIGALQAAQQLGRDFTRLLVFSSLSKRSNVPGMRSGFIAGDANLLEKFLLYRTYQGSALSPVVQTASIAAWKDEEHVIMNRQRYTEKFFHVQPILSRVLDVSMPDAGFYLWVKVSNTGLNDQLFAKELYEKENVIVLPGSFLARMQDGVNPGAGYVRIALVATLEECVEGARRIVEFCYNLG